MLTKDERSMAAAKVRVVEEAIEDLRAALDPNNELAAVEVHRRSIAARNAVAELRRYILDDLS